MNSDALAKLYGQLRPIERLPLIIAAADRGDLLERDRLANSAPARLYRMQDYHGLADALTGLTLLHLAGLLELAARYWRACSLVKSAADCWAKGDRCRELAEGTPRLLAYPVCAEWDGWGLFCKGPKVAPDALLKVLPGFETARAAEQGARPVAFSHAEGEAFLVASGLDAARPPTAEELGEGWRAALAQKAAEWG
jgi:hypothetical protein